MSGNNNHLWCETTPRDRANGRRLMFWSLAWAATMLFASAAAAGEGIGGRPVALIAAMLVTHALAVVVGRRRFV